MLSCKRITSLLFFVNYFAVLSRVFYSLFTFKVMKKIIFLFYLLFLTMLSFAQNWKLNYQKADSLAQRRLFKEAVLQYEQTLSLAEKEFGKQSEEYLLTRNGWGKNISLIGEKEKAAQILAENIELCRQKGEKTILYTQALLNVGIFYLPINKGNDAVKSEKYLQEALVIRKEIFGTKHADYAQALQALANLYFTTNQYLLAESYYKEALQIRKDVLGVGDNNYLVILNNLGVLYTNMGNYAAAERYYNETVRIRKETLGVKHLSYIYSLGNLAILQQTMGNYKSAEKNLKIALNTKKEVLGEKHKDYISSLRNLGILYKNMGNYVKAEQVYKNALALQKELGGENSKDYALRLGDLGVIYQYLKDYATAEKLYTEALQIYEKQVGKDHPDYALAVAHLAELYRDLGKYALADSLVNQSFVVFKKNPNSDLFWDYNNKGLIYTAQKRYAEAEQNLLAAGELTEKWQGKTGLNTIFNRQCLALLYWESRQTEKATQLFLENKNSAITQITQLFPMLSESEKAKLYDERLKKSFEDFNAYVIDEYEKGKPQTSNDQLYDLQLFSKGILLNASQKMKNRIFESKDSTLIREYENWSSFKLSLVKYQQMPKEELQKARINLDSLLEISNDMEKALSLRSEEFVKISDTKTTTWRDIQRKLNKKEAAIEIFRLNKLGVQKNIVDSSAVGYPRYAIYGQTDTVYYAALIVKKDSKQPELVLLKDGNNMEGSFFKRYRNSVQFNVTDKHSYQNYWLPLKKYLKGIQKVYFSPDGIYNQINLNILRNPESQEYLFDEIDIQQLTNTKEIVALNSTQKDGESNKNSENIGGLNRQNFKAMLFGRPAYDMDSISYLVNIALEKQAEPSYALRDIRDLRNSKISDLIGTETEVRQIDSLLQSRALHTEKYILEKATEHKIKNLHRPSILHIATHGFFIQGLNGDNPMLNSGILLSGVSNYYRSEEQNYDTDDGVLTAHEAQNLHLEGTDLVVLSACETGLGEIRNGEGVYGLQRAFKVAGAKTILMSHWKVDDHVTQELMVKFYENWLKVGNRREAFRLAQTYIRQKYEKPSLWGAFVLVGE